MRGLVDRLRGPVDRSRDLVNRVGLARAVAFTLSTTAVFAVGFVPLFDGPGYEISLAAGLIVPSLAAIAVALDRSLALTKARDAGTETRDAGNAREAGKEARDVGKEAREAGKAARDTANAISSEISISPVAERSDGDVKGVNGAPSGLQVSPLDVLRSGIATGAAFGLAAWGTTLIHGVRTGFCDFWSGTTNFALGPLVGAILGGAWGALAAEIASRRSRPRAGDHWEDGVRSAEAELRLAERSPQRKGRSPRRSARRAVAIALGIAGPLGAAAVSFARFLSSPMVFAYDPFAGYFSGTLYDTVIDAGGLWTYRAGSAATLAAAVVLAMHLARKPDGTLTWQWSALGGIPGTGGRRAPRAVADTEADAPPPRSSSPSSSRSSQKEGVSRRPWGVALFGVGCAIASVVHSAKGTELGHYQTVASIAEALGGHTEGKRCTVLHPRGMGAQEVARFVRDCDAHVGQVEAWFEAKGPARITVYLFADVHQKASLMGASDTQIAKPWRGEVYVQQASYPHSVLGHELAHVIAGSFARGPFKTGGDVLGLLPNPGLIEGVAVAASPREGDLSSAEWAKAMKDLGILPKLHDLFGLAFLGASSGVAYTVSGAFVGFVKETYGAAAVRDWYGGKALPDVTGASWGDLEAKFLAMLDALPLTDAARAQAKARFDRPGLFARRCPHVVDLCNRRADGLRGGGDEQGALEQYAIVKALDPGDRMLRVQIARTRIHALDLATGTAELRGVVADESVPRSVRDRALEDLADLALAPGGDGVFAAASYRELMARTVDEDALRTLEVKAMAAETPRARGAIFQFLIGDPGRGSDRVRAGELFGAWASEAPNDGMPHYLMARYLAGAGLYGEALLRLSTALARTLPSARVEAEAWRLRIVGSCAVGDPAAARNAYDAYRQLPLVPKARRDAMAALLARCSEAGDGPAGR